MRTASRTISARIPESVLREAASLRPDASVSEMILEALAVWLNQLRRQHEDEVIAEALASISPQQQAEARDLVRAAGRSAQRVVEQADG
ncbi:MAG: hypothetical protein JXA69_12075 [Phycisphaerae bacterium]|nr:hypothetical protein [Phycisphaerae bacterium]